MLLFHTYSDLHHANHPHSRHTTLTVCFTSSRIRVDECGRICFYLNTACRANINSEGLPAL